MNTFKKLFLSIASVAVVGGATASLVLLSNDANEMDASAVTSNWDDNQFIINPFFKNDTGWSANEDTTVYNPIEQCLYINNGHIYIECNKFPNKHILQEELTLQGDGRVNTYLQTHGGNFEYGFDYYYNLIDGVKTYCYNQAIFDNEEIANNPIFIFQNDQSNNSWLFNVCIFDLTGIFGSGKEPDKETFHQQFLGYQAGYKSGVSDGAKTQISTSITGDSWSFSENMGSTLYSAKFPHYYSSKAVGQYYNQSQNIYWDSSMYGNVKATEEQIIDSSAITGYDAYERGDFTYFQLANYTKYLNTTSTSVDFNANVKVTASSLFTLGTCSISASYTVYYTTQSMAQWADVSTWITNDPIVPSNAFLKNCEVIKTGTFSNKTTNETNGGNVLNAINVEVSKDNITDTSFSIFVVLTGFTRTNDNTWLDSQHGDYGQSTGNTYKLTPGTLKTVFEMDKALSINYEVIDLPGFFYTLLTAPFSFISTAFNVTLFSGTPYALNISSLIMGVLGSALIIIVIKIIGSIIKSL